MTRARDVANLIGSGNYSSTTFTATAGQTAFTIAHTQGFIQVFMNGLLLDETVDWTSDGSTVTLTSGAAAGDEIEVVAYNTFSVGDALNQAAADTRYVNASGDTMSGDLTIDTNTFHVDVADNRVGIGTTAPTNQLTITDGIATPYGAADEVLLDLKRGTTNTATNKATALRLGNNSNGARLSYGGASDTMNIIMGSGNITATFRNDGGMTLPYQPVFQAYGLSSGATGNFLTFVNTRINVGNHYSTSNGRFTVPVAGSYLFGWSNIGYTTNTVYRYYLRKNGSDIGDIHLRQDNTGSGAEYATNATMTIPLSCAVNDYIQIYYYADDGSTSTYTGADYPLFWGYLIG